MNAGIGTRGGVAAAPRRRRGAQSRPAIVEVSRTGQASEWLAIAIAVLAPLPLGSEDPSWVAIWCVGLAVSLLLADLRHLRGHQVGIALRITVVFLILCGIVVVQMEPVPALGAADPAWGDAGRMLGVPLAPRASITASNLFLSAGPMLLFVLTFCRFVLLPVGGSGAARLFAALRWAAIAYALASTLLFLVNPQALLWTEKVAYQANLTGTFVNRNTAATFFGTCSILWMIQTAREIRWNAGDFEWSRADLLNSAKNLPPSLIVSALCFLVCFSATIMTGSRAGFLLSLAMTGLGIVLYTGVRRRKSGPGVLVLIGILALLLVLAEFWGQTLAGRIGQGGLSDANRLESFATTRNLIADHPWLGVGLGNFATGFPEYRVAALGIVGIWDRAHNTILEIAAEMGLPAAGLVVALWIWEGGALLWRFRLRERDRIYPIAAICVGLLAGLHSLVDFSLQVPGYAVVFAAIVATGLGQCAPVRAD